MESPQPVIVVDTASAAKSAAAYFLFLIIEILSSLFCFLYKYDGFE